MNMKVINLTPHSINLVTDDGDELLTIPPSGTVARVSQDTKSLAVFNLNGVDVPITHNVYGDIEGLPAPSEDTQYVVSAMVASAVNGKRKGKRNDILVPNESVRDDAGRIVGCKSLARVF
jgi:hypothetical protein